MAELLLPRRRLLKHLGVAGVGMVMSACGDGNGKGPAAATETPDPTPTQSFTPSPSQSPTAAIPTRTESPTSVPSPSPTATPEVPPSCVLTPEQTQGPFFLDTGLLRRDITEGRPGTPLRLVLQIVDVDNGCMPIRDAVVEAWHADADGVYSGFIQAQGNPTDATGETFLRGFQVSDENGRIEFTTIYPGWYPGRTVHVHVKVLLDATRLLVSQLYFPDSLTDEVFSQAPYDTRGVRSTLNSEDAIFRNGGANLIMNIVGNGASSPPHNSSVERERAISRRIQERHQKQSVGFVEDVATPSPAGKGRSQVAGVFQRAASGYVGSFLLGVSR